MNGHSQALRLNNMQSVLSSLAHGGSQPKTGVVIGKCHQGVGRVMIGYRFVGSPETSRTEYFVKYVASGQGAIEFFPEVGSQTDKHLTRMQASGCRDAQRKGQYGVHTWYILLTLYKTLDLEFMEYMRLGSLVYLVGIQTTEV